MLPFGYAFAVPPPLAMPNFESASPAQTFPISQTSFNVSKTAIALSRLRVISFV
jgi:hypothetical protein